MAQYDKLGRVPVWKIIPLSPRQRIIVSKFFFTRFDLGKAAELLECDLQEVEDCYRFWKTQYPPR